MSQWWLAIASSLQFTRVQLMSEAGKSVLRTRLPQGPQHPQTVPFLAEALSPRCVEPLHVVLAVDGPGSLCAACCTHRWQAALDLLTRLPLYKIEYRQAFPSDADMCRQVKARPPRT
jgi:hypothetical protein